MNIEMLLKKMIQNYFPVKNYLRSHIIAPKVKIVI
jgi:hypothetical protein